jgi:hypothetical protein
MKAQHVSDLAGFHQLQPGQWTRDADDGVIYACCPNGLMASLASHTTTVDFTVDGTPLLTVSPSILCTDGAGGHQFHGFIENGVWLGEDRQPCAEPVP